MKWRVSTSGHTVSSLRELWIGGCLNNLDSEARSYELCPLSGHTPTTSITLGRGAQGCLLPVRGDPSWRESPTESRRGEKSGPRTILGLARTGLLVAAGPHPRTLSPELRGAEQSGEKSTDEASATSVPWHPAPAELDELESTRGDIALSPE